MRLPATIFWIKSSASFVLASERDGRQGQAQPLPSVIPGTPTFRNPRVLFIILDFWKNRKTQKKTIDISQTLWHNEPRRKEIDEPSRSERLGTFLDAYGKSPNSS